MTPTQQQASRLADLWHRLSTQHVALGCACSMAGVSVTLEDFERDIGDYLWAESERLGETAVVALLLASGPMAGQPHPIRDCLVAGSADQNPGVVCRPSWPLAGGPVVRGISPMGSGLPHLMPAPWICCCSLVPAPHRK
jgi:hypothetical protein